jgi:hypothetical protein
MPLKKMLLRKLRAWRVRLAYRPERHYMRGGRSRA